LVAKPSTRGISRASPLLRSGGERAMQLLLNNPLWIVIIVVTILLHVAFFIGILRVMRKAKNEEE
jgi:flagellar basal body-associated protein FliL